MWTGFDLRDPPDLNGLWQASRKMPLKEKSPEYTKLINCWIL